MDPLSPGAAVLFDPEARTWLGFGPPKHVICATRVSEVAAALCRVEESVNSANLYAVGFLSYEASPAFDSACEVRPSGGFPLLWFGLYAKPRSIEIPEIAAALATLLDWEMEAVPFGPGVSPCVFPHQKMHRPRRNVPGELFPAAARALFRQLLAFLCGPCRRRAGRL